MDLEIKEYIRYENNIPDLLTSPIFRKIKTIPIDFTYNTLNTEPMDLVALKTMGSSDYWWLIALYNDILNPLAVSGKINIPNKTELVKILSDCRLDTKK